MVITDIMARGLLLLSQLLPLSQLLLLSLDMDTDMDTVMDTLAMAMEDMDTMDIMARDPLMLSLDMAMVMDMDTVAMDTMDIMARGPLMPDMAMVDMDMVMV